MEGACVARPLFLYLLGTVVDPHAADHVPLDDAVHYVHPLHDMPEDGVAAVEMRLR